MPLYPKIINLGLRVVEYDSTIYTTLQDAIDYCESLTESAVTDNDGVTLLLPPGDFTAQTILIKKHVSLVGTNKSQIGTITYRPTSAISGPRTVSLKNLFIQNLNVLAETAAASGIFYPDIFDTTFNIDDCDINAIIGNRINNFKIKDCYMVGGTAVYTYCSNIIYIGGKPGSVEIHVNDSASNPPTNGSASTLYFMDSFVNGLVDLYKDAGATTAFLGIYNSYVETLTLNGNCDVAIRGSGSINKDNLTLLNTNNNFVEHESWGAYNPTIPGNWTSSPIWIRDALDELAGRSTSGGVSDGDKGDITVSSSGTVWTIDNNVITNAKLADVPTQTFKGRTTAATGDPEDLTIAQAKTLLDLTGTNSGDQTITLTSDVTGSGSGSFATTIANDAVTNAKAANMATKTYKGRTTAGTGDPEDVAVATLKTDLNLVKADVGLGSVVNADTTTTANITDSTNKRFVTDANITTIGNQSGINTGDQTISLTSDVTGSGTGSFATTIANNAVTNAKAADMATSTFKGRVTAATGDPEDLTVAQAKTLLNLTGTNSGDITVENSGTPLTQRTTINFTGAGVSSVDSGGKTVVTIPGGAGSGATGTTTVDFGAFPGKSDTSIAVTGQTSIVAGSIVNAWIRPVATADHSADEHLIETIRIIAGNIVAATGFTIYAFNTSEKNEYPLGWLPQGNKDGKMGMGTRIYGLWTVQWKWE